MLSAAPSPLGRLPHRQLDAQPSARPRRHILPASRCFSFIPGKNPTSLTDPPLHQVTQSSSLLRSLGYFLIRRRQFLNTSTVPVSPAVSASQQSFQLLRQGGGGEGGNDLPRLDSFLCPQTSRLPSLNGPSDFLARLLRLSGCEALTDAALEPITRSLTALEELSLAWCQELTDVGAALLPRLPRLTSLQMGGCVRLTDAAALEISTLQSLRCLSLADCSLSDAGCPFIARLEVVTELDLNGCRSITSRGVISLVSDLKMLRSLDLRGTQVTAEAAAALTESHPELSITVRMF